MLSNYVLITGGSDGIGLELAKLFAKDKHNLVLAARNIEKLNKAKEILAYELTTLVHSEEDAVAAQESSRALFSQGNAANMPTVELSEDDLEEGKIDIISLLVKADLAPTRSEARRNIQQGGVSVNGEKVTDIQATVAKEELVEGAVVKRGKKKFKKVVVK